MVKNALKAAALIAVLAVTLLLVTGGAEAGTGSGLNLSSSAAITSYLTSHGIDPATMTWQKGPKNYAGPNCPGRGWTCTTSTHVVQMAKPGGQNRFECTGQPTGTDTCVIVQSQSTNHARCTITDTTEPTAVDSCTIGQQGDRNSADVNMTINQGTGPTQDGQQTAQIDQIATDRNQAQVYQTINQDTSADTTQNQNGHQLATVNQYASGDNFSHVHQSLDQAESGAATSQAQNTAGQPLCENKNANQCAQVNESSNGGSNDSHLEQATGERQTTSADGGTQTQGDFTNGQEGAIHQVNPPNLGSNHDTSHLTLAQRESGPAGTTFQRQSTDPRCCGGSQVGGSLNRENIDEDTTQSASDPNADQFSDLFGEAHQTAGDALSSPLAPTTSPGDLCSIDQQGRNNSDSGHFSVSGNDPVTCASLILETICESGVESSGTCGPPIDDLSRPLAIASLPTSPTLGADIAMPDYNALPADYVDPGGWW